MEMLAERSFPFGELNKYYTYAGGKCALKTTADRGCGFCAFKNNTYNLTKGR